MPTYTIILQEKGSAKAKKNVDSVNKSLGGLAKKAGIAAAGFVAVNKVFDGLNQSVQAAGKFEGVSTGFDNLRKSSGMSAAAFSKFNKALDGTATSTELMTMANNAMLLGITDSEDQMAKMFDTAQRLAKAVGEDAAFGVNSLVTGIGRQSKLMLDNLGIMVDTQKAYEDYAEGIGLTAAALDDEQKKAINDGTAPVESFITDLISGADVDLVAKDAELQARVNDPNDSMTNDEAVAELGRLTDIQALRDTVVTTDKDGNLVRNEEEGSLHSIAQSKHEEILRGLEVDFKEGKFNPVPI